MQVYQQPGEGEGRAVQLQRGQRSEWQLGWPAHVVCSSPQLRELWAEGAVHQKTRCWAQGMDGWRPLEQIAQLKWSLLATGIPLLNESDMASRILDTLIRICNFYPSRWPACARAPRQHEPSHHQSLSHSLYLPLPSSPPPLLLPPSTPHRDSDGAIIRPLPRAKRMLSEPTMLPHVVQLLLTFDPGLVERVVILLNIIVKVGIN